MNTYTTTVGIEVHAELKTKSKMFCGCANDPHNGEPNMHICPVCMAHPGTLPVVNKEAVGLVLKVGTALQGKVADFSEFDRKNYFYPDIPKAYQISQYQFPFIEGGELAGVAITRVHLEEDTARSQHDQGEESLVDFNRAGVPLMELVTEPVIHSGKQAAQFAKELQLLLRTLGVSDANMERGEMRVEANISVSATDTLGTKVEVKNLNSFRSVELAVEFETARQIACIEAGKTVVQETRGFDEQKGVTFSQRAKETADDYRYFPDPDIPKFLLTKVPEFINRLDEKSLETPSKIRARYANLGLTSDQIETLVSDQDFYAFFEEAISHIPAGLEARTIANYLLTDVTNLLSSELTLKQAHIPPFLELLLLATQGTITSRVAKDLLPEVLFEGVNPHKVAESRGLLQQNSEDSLMPLVLELIEQNKTVVAEYMAGKDSALQFLVGQGMKATKGSANPGLLLEMLKKQIARS
jgi:aspartyl-tRNA(Asn)/glutamyl-tRNA(Gln) amidotransferase subunit B